MAVTFDIKEFVVRLAKYLLEGIVVATAAFFIASSQLDFEQVMMVGLTAACTFSLIDWAAPSVSSSVRQGAGLSLGAGLMGGFPTANGALPLR
jgi:hypothetical protein